MEMIACSQVHFSKCVGKADQNSPHIIGTDGNQMWATGEWSQTVQGTNFGPIAYCVRGVLVGLADAFAEMDLLEHVRPMFLDGLPTVNHSCVIH